MALLPPFFLDAVVSIGGVDEDKKEHWFGTGVLYAIMDDPHDRANPKGTPFLVTNRHVLEGREEILIRTNSRDGHSCEAHPLRLVENGKPIWHTFQSEEIDVAIVLLSADYLIRHNVTRNYVKHPWDVADKRRVKELGILEGNGVFVLGFPLGMLGVSHNYPLVRQGIVARIRDWLDGESRLILIDSMSFPGNSGGPVVARPEANALPGTKPLHEAPLIGLVASYTAYRDVALSQQTGQVRVVFEENAGIAQVVPIHYVAKLIRQYYPELFEKY